MNRHVVVLILLATVAVPVIAQQNRDPILPTRDAKCSDIATLDVKNMTVKSLGVPEASAIASCTELSTYPPPLVPVKNSTANHELLPTAKLPADAWSKLDR